MCRRWNPKVLYFNDHGAFELATAYGTLCVRVMHLHLDIRGPDADKVILSDLHNMLLDRWGFDLADNIDIKLDPGARRIEFRQKWWDRSQRKPVEPCGPYSPYSSSG